MEYSSVLELEEFEKAHSTLPGFYVVLTAFCKVPPVVFYRMQFVQVWRTFPRCCICEV